MTDRTQSTEEQSATASDARDELRTIAFRLREIQRLLGARVEQENRRLDAAGLEPVSRQGSSAAGDDRDGEPE